MQPARGIARLIQAGFQVLGRYRVVNAKTQVILAGPLHAYSLAGKCHEDEIARFLAVSEEDDEQCSLIWYYERASRE